MARTRQNIERDLVAAKAELAAAQAGDRTDMVAYVEACRVAQVEVRRLEQELANLRPDPLAGLLTPPVRLVAPAVTPAPATGAPTPQTTPAATTVRRRRTPAAPPPVQTLSYNSVNWVPWVVSGLVALLLLVWAMQLFSPGRRQVNTGRQVSAPERTIRQPAAQPPTSQPTYRDCMFSYGERRELADGRCDHLQ